MSPLSHASLSAVALLCLALLSVPMAASALTVTGISPAEGYLGTVFSCEVSGTGFVAGVPGVPGTQVGLAGGGTTIEATGETVITSGRLLCTFAIPLDADTGSYILGVANSPTVYDYKTDGFTVLAPTPTVAGASPNSAAPGETLSAVYVSGTDFVPGAEVRISGFQEYDTLTIYATGETRLDATTLRCALAIPGDAYPGWYTLGVRNPGGSWVELENGFRVVAPTPSITGISPGSASYGETLSTVYLYGTNFTNGADVKIYKNDGWGVGGFLWMGETFINSTTLRFNLYTVDVENYYPGWYWISVTNPGGAVAYKADAFRIITPTPVITGVSPNSGAPGERVGVNVHGSNFTIGAQFRVRGGTGGTTAVSSRNAWRTNSTAIQGSLDIPEDAYPGWYTLGVWNPDGGPENWVEAANAFRVVAPTPAVTGASPNRAAPGETLSTVYVSGTGFSNGAEVFIYGPGYGTTIDATGETFINSTAIRCSLVVPGAAAPGPYSVYVMTSTGTVSHATDAFTVTAPGVVQVPTGAGLPTDTNGDGRYDDVNGNTRRDFADVVLYFNQMTWISIHEPMAAFDCNGNGRIDFADVVWLFNHL